MIELMMGVTAKRMSAEQVNAEKALKPRPDLLPAFALLAAGRVQAYGWHKHGDCTWKNEGTEQAKPETHLASAMRHLLEHLEDPEAVEEGSRLPVLWHALCQIAIAIDCIERQRKSTQNGDEATQSGAVAK